MLRHIVVLGLALSALPALGQSLGQSLAPSGWEYVDKDRDVEVFRKEVAGSDVVAFRGITTANLAIGKLLAVFNDPDDRKHWVDRYEEHVTLEKGQYRETYWIHFALPFPVSDRDYVLQAVGTPDEASRTFKVRINSVEHPKKAGEDDCCVRAIAMRTYYEFTALPNGQTKIVVEVHTDPKGALPNWLVNLIQKSWPSKTLGGLVEYVAKSNKAPMPEFARWHDPEVAKKVEEVVPAEAVPATP